MPTTIQVALDRVVRKQEERLIKNTAYLIKTTVQPVIERTCAKYRMGFYKEGDTFWFENYPTDATKSRKEVDELMEDLNRTFNNKKLGSYCQEMRKWEIQKKVI